MFRDSQLLIALEAKLEVQSLQKTTRNIFHICNIEKLMVLIILHVIVKFCHSYAVFTIRRIARAAEGINYCTYL
jgi:hypothetical protein